jgi:CubicO group peptidase (beta-lactamase class C family)
MLPRRFLLTFVFLPALLRAEDAVNEKIRKIEARWNPAQSMAKLRVPGLSIAVIRDSKVEWVKPYGVKSAKAKAKVTDNVDVATLFQAASISKPVAAVAAMHMSQYGNFGLDEDVNAKLTSWKVKDTASTAEAKVTLRGLLSHTAGLTVHGFGGYAAGEPVPTIQQILNGEKPANSAPVIVDQVPGTKWRYSGGGYTVLQLLMQDRLKKSFAEIMEMIVLQKLGMRDSTYAQPLPKPLHLRAAHGHNKEGQVLKGEWHTYPEQAAAGLWTTPSDLARFLIEMQKSARGESNKVIERKTALQMLTIQKDNYGLGFRVSRDGVFGHGGSNEGFKCYMAADARNGFVIMTNGDRGMDLIKEIAAAIEAEYGWANLKP